MRVNSLLKSKKIKTTKINHKLIKQKRNYKTLHLKRVVVTGLGMVSPLGGNVQESWENVLLGKSGVKVQEVLKDIPVKIAASIDDYDASLIPKSYASQLSRPVSIGLVAVQQALNDAKWDGDKNDVGVAIGSSFGSFNDVIDGYDKMLQSGLKRVTPFFYPKILGNMTAGYASIIHGFTGHISSPSTACSTGMSAVGEAYRVIQRGEAKCMVSGATESGIHPLSVGGFLRARALASSFNDEPTKASRPFDVKREGFVMGEGAGILILEELESALARNAKIYAEITGFGLRSEAHHITSPSATGDGAYNAMNVALIESGISKLDMDYINAHATSTPLGDEAEYLAITKLFEGNKSLTVSSTKGHTGHLLSAAGSVEAIFTLKAMETNTAPHTLNLEQTSFTNESYLNRAPIQKQINHVMNNSFGFGGVNASMIFSRFKS